MTSAEPEAEEVIQADTKVAGDAGAEIATVEAPEVVEEATQGPKAEDLFLLARQQNFEVALKLLEAYPDFWHCQDEDGHSLMHWAALVGNKDFVKAALAQKLPVDSVAKNQQTPLMWAVLRGHVPVARTLLAAKASLAVKDSLGATALMIAVQHKAYPSILLLMHRGSHMQAQMLAEGDKNGCTAVHWAAYKGDLTALKLLHYFKADLQVLDNAKMLPLHRAVCAAQTAVVEFLVEQKSDPQARNHEGKSCLDIAAEKHDVHMQALLKRLVSKVPADPFAGGKVEPEDVEAGKDKAEKSGKKSFFKGLMQDKTAHKIFPVFWLVCVSLAVFQYLMDLRLTSYEVAPSTAFLFEVLVPISLGIFSFVALGDPGKVPARPQGNSGVEELMKALDTDAADNDPPDVNRLCTTTWVLKGLRTKYCVQTGACVEEFDHYCVWLNNTIGKANHRQFVGLAVVEFLTQVTHIRLCLLMASTLVPYQSFTQFVWGVLTGYPLLTLIVLVHCITAPWVFMLTLHQARLVMMNLTTNEMMNMHRYEHFWVVRTMVTGHAHKTFRNPFNKVTRIVARKGCVSWCLVGITPVRDNSNQERRRGRRENESKRCANRKMRVSGYAGTCRCKDMRVCNMSRCEDARNWVCADASCDDM
ncbi:unnamed protein product [Durusdinium trenchii]|uniref:Palmitoyltransferase n=1 Tax=Durusdinium trenchii TaxID=1381693 RepID=A0ABP0KQI9_9DINO